MGGVIIGSNSNIKYSLYFKKSKNSKVTIGDDFVFFSGDNLNPLVLDEKGRYLQRKMQ